jgi:hypothetical protein
MMIGSVTAAATVVSTIADAMKSSSSPKRAPNTSASIIEGMPASRVDTRTSIGSRRTSDASAQASAGSATSLMAAALPAHVRCPRIHPSSSDRPTEIITSGTVMLASPSKPALTTFGTANIEARAPPRAPGAPGT